MQSKYVALIFPGLYFAYNNMCLVYNMDVLADDFDVILQKKGKKTQVQ